MLYLIFKIFYLNLVINLINRRFLFTKKKKNAKTSRLKSIYF